MTLQRARIVKGAPGHAVPQRPTMPREGFGRRVPRDAVDARMEAARILDAARQEASAIVAAARSDAAHVAEAAAREARNAETARLAAEFLALRRAEDDRARRDVDRSVELATLLAERLVGEGLRIDPARITELAAAALTEARGARRVQIDACPDDVGALREALASIDAITEIRADAELSRGSLVVHTDLGIVDARLRPQLARLADALREALR